MIFTKLLMIVKCLINIIDKIYYLAPLFLMKLKTFLLYAEAASQIDLLSNEEAGQLFKALFHYVADGSELVTDNRVLAMTFAVFKAQIDRGANKYEETCRKRTEAINKRWERYKSIQMNTNEYNCIDLNTNEGNNNPIPKPKPQNKKESIKKNPIDAAHAAALLEGRKEDFYNSLIPFVAQYGKEMVRAFFDYWSEPNKSNSKMRFELEKTWDVARRLSYWASRENQFNNRNNGTGGQSNSTPQSRAEDAAAIVARLLAEDDARK